MKLNCQLLDDKNMILGNVSIEVNCKNDLINDNVFKLALQTLCDELVQSYENYKKELRFFKQYDLETMLI